MNYHVRVVEGDRSREALEGFLLYCVVVAGKNAQVQQRKLNEFLALVPSETPFASIRAMGGGNRLESNLRRVGMGQYTRLRQAFHDLAWLLATEDLMEVPVARLEKFRGIGPKTARYFAIYARDERCAALDTHILKFLRDIEGIKAPKSTPQAGHGYRVLEEAFLDAAKRYRMSPQVLDGHIWQYYSGNHHPDALKFTPKEFFLLLTEVP